MDERRQARVVALGMLRGLVSPEDLRKAAAVSDEGLLDALVSQGVLDETDVEVLDAIPEEAPAPVRRRGSPLPGMKVDPDSSPDTGNLWQGFAETSPATGEEGRRVRESFSLPSWGAYQDLEFLADGGLGRIFRAFDPSLKRIVALKFLRRDDPELMQRFVLEAQHQATVEHPNICKVFEVGEWRGQSFIAMQYIRGETLEAAAPRMSLPEKVETMEIVAEAIHAAHRQGLTHRDIKPANIMVERPEDGRPKPCVLDFGLARGAQGSGLTLHGMVIGTTNYMAPEQALGQVDRIGRRTDVYGLGATLYRLLTGRMVFQGSDGLDSMRRTVEEEPVPPRKWVPDLPGDLEVIVLKCLEKDPQRRYESARALAEDLRRFREGEPISARRSTLPYRAVKFAKRHKVLMSISTAALTFVFAMGCWGITSSLRARRVSGFSASFGAQAEQMATRFRTAYLLPHQDIRSHKATVRDQMEHIRAVVRAEGRLAEGPGAYALGQGHLALREYAEARRELERAWSLGYRNAQVALALGQALGELYREEWEKLPQIGDLDQRETRKRALQKQFRDPALTYLRLGAGENPERKAHQEGLLAYYEEQYAAAIAKAREAYLQDPALYEAKMLEGNALVAMGMVLQDSRPDVFLQRLQEAGAPYAVALDIARSDPALLAAEGTRRCELARYAFFYVANPRDDYARIQAYLDQVLLVDPDAAGIYLTKSRLAEAYAVFLEDHGRNPFPVLDEAIAWCRKAAALTEGDLFVASSLGDLYRWKATYQRNRGMDPVGSLEQAFEHWQEAISLRPGDAWIHQRLAEACSMQSEIAFDRGEDPQPSLNRGLFHIKEAFRLSGSTSTAMSGANLLCCLGDWQRDHGQDPSPSYQQALEYYRLAVTKAPADGDCLTGIADVAVRYATHLRQIGEPPDPVLQRGLEAAEKSVALSPTFLRLLNQGDCLRLLAQLQLDGGQDPFPAIGRARSAFRASGNLNPRGDYTLFWYQGVLATVEGEANAARERSPEPAWVEADRLLARSQQMNPRAVEPLVCAARLAWMRADWRRRHRLPYLAAVEAGLSAAERGFSLKARQPELRALRGCLLRLKAETLSGPSARERMLAQARQDLLSALEENRFLEREFHPELDKTFGP